ncbi:hypothetical protein ACHQM5_025188 [Ranunculus cassubicifolius]
MAACTGGVSKIKLLPEFEIRRNNNNNNRSVNEIKPWGTRQNALPFSGLVLSRRTAGNSLLAVPNPEIETTSNLDVELEGAKSIETQNQMTPNAFQVESLLSEICDTSSIAEFELKFGGFRLYVTRNVYGKDTPSPLQNHFPLGTDMAIQASDSNGSVSSQSLAISKPAASGGESLTLLEKASDKGLKILNSPRVGFFRRSRIIKGKRAPPPCKENQIVKEGQVLCYIEQLGGQIPIESDVAGEVVKILKKDGEPVGYGDALMEILPSFPGIKKLQ